MVGEPTCASCCEAPAGEDGRTRLKGAAVVSRETPVEGGGAQRSPDVSRGRIPGVGGAAQRVEEALVAHDLTGHRGDAVRADELEREILDVRPAPVGSEAEAPVAEGRVAGALEV